MVPVRVPTGKIMFTDKLTTVTGTSRWARLTINRPVELSPMEGISPYPKLIMFPQTVGVSVAVGVNQVPVGEGVLVGVGVFVKESDGVTVGGVVAVPCETTGVIVNVEVGVNQVPVGVGVGVQVSVGVLTGGQRKLYLSNSQIERPVF